MVQRASVGNGKMHNETDNWENKRTQNTSAAKHKATFGSLGEKEREREREKESTLLVDPSRWLNRCSDGQGGGHEMDRSRFRGDEGPRAQRARGRVSSVCGFDFRFAARDVRREELWPMAEGWASGVQGGKQHPARRASSESELFGGPVFAAGVRHHPRCQRIQDALQADGGGCGSCRHPVANAHMLMVTKSMSPWFRMIPL